MKLLLTILCLYQLYPASVLGDSEASIQSDRKGKALSLFQIVKFQNTRCMTGVNTNTNGTCYTAEECRTKLGTSEGTCAGGYGVCCIFRIRCGQRTSEQYSVLESTLATVGARTCQYDICRSSPNICRIRLDFTRFVIAPPVLGLTVPLKTDIPSTTNGASIGDCITDQFSVSSPGSFGSPVICGFNTGQHMFVDATEMCSKVLFNFGAAATTMREWEIKVTQFACGDEMGGPPGCLQYHTGIFGTFASFNYPTASPMVLPTTTHLSNQQYSICFRQEMNMCAICYFPTIGGVPVVPVVMTPGVMPPTIMTDPGVAPAVMTPALAVAMPVSFGLSVSYTGKARGEWDQKCSEDYLEIPGAVHVTMMIPLKIGPISATTNVRSRACGRFLNLADAGADRQNSMASVCTQMKPFRVTFVTNGDEVTTAPDGTRAAKTGDPRVNEQGLFPGGIMGFSLDYRQVNC